jgi:hypothetical protein
VLRGWGKKKKKKKNKNENKKKGGAPRVTGAPRWRLKPEKSTAAPGR